MAETAFRTELVDQLLEWNILMCISRERRFFDPSQQLAEARVSRQIGPQNQSICEKTNQPFDFSAVTVSDGRAHDNVFLGAIAR